MFLRTLSRFGLVAIVLPFLTMPLPALAGGWAVVTLDSTPADVRAEAAFNVGFTVLQHGKTPMQGLEPVISFWQLESAVRGAGLAMVSLAKPSPGDRVTLTAQEAGEAGHYVATITLPSAGVWQWEIAAFGEPALMSPLQVGTALAKAAPADQSVLSAQAASFPLTKPWLALTGIAVLGTLVAALLLFRRRTVIQS
ncbi:MAG: hypothetical protein MI924_38345 [Chloroflexales bacterium]|nr:hypothetical protein [Chloroflexales bacterium]